MIRWFNSYADTHDMVWEASVLQDEAEQVYKHDEKTYLRSRCSMWARKIATRWLSLYLSGSSGSAEQRRISMVVPLLRGTSYS